MVTKTNFDWQYGFNPLTINILIIKKQVNELVSIQLKHWSLKVRLDRQNSRIMIDWVYQGKQTQVFPLMLAST